MNAMITQHDLSAYVDDQLDPWQRIAVEEWLAQHPHEAAAVMADLRLRDELRQIFPPLPLPRDVRLAGAVGRRSTMRKLAPWGLAASVCLAVWLMFGPVGLQQGIAAPPPPSFVEAALSARDASELRLAMISQPEVLHYDATEMRALTGIVIPQVPDTWAMRDVQVFPSPEGPGVAMVFDTPLHGRMSVFIVRALDEPPELGSTRQQGLDIAWFAHHGVFYVLAGNGPVEAMTRTARQLAEGLI